MPVWVVEFIRLIGLTGLLRIGLLTGLLRIGLLTGLYKCLLTGLEGLSGSQNILPVPLAENEAIPLRAAEGAARTFLTHRFCQAQLAEEFLGTRSGPQ